jgi:hypothetical protein
MSWVNSGLTTVYSGNAVNAWTDLDLSATIGAHPTLVYLSIAYGSALTVSLRPNGDTTEWYRAAYCCSGGTSRAIVASGGTCLITVTDANGILEWRTNATGAGCVIKLLGYIQVTPSSETIVNGIIPNTWTTKDLSSVIGNVSTLCFTKGVSAFGALQQYAFRPYNDTSGIYLDTYLSDVGGAHRNINIGSGYAMGAIALSDSLGQVEYAADVAATVNVNVTLRGYTEVQLDNTVVFSAAAPPTTWTDLNVGQASTLVVLKVRRTGNTSGVSFVFRQNGDTLSYPTTGTNPGGPIAAFLAATTNKTALIVVPTDSNGYVEWLASTAANNLEVTLVGYLLNLVDVDPTIDSYSPLESLQPFPTIDVSFSAGRFLDLSSTQITATYNSSVVEVVTNGVLQPHFDGTLPLDGAQAGTFSFSPNTEGGFIVGTWHISVYFEDSTSVSVTQEWDIVVDTVAWTSTDTIVFSGTLSSHWNTLDLSSIVGENRAVCFFALTAESGGTNLTFADYIGQGETAWSPTSTVHYGSGTSHSEWDYGTKTIAFLCPTHTSGVLNIHSYGDSTGVVIRLLGYFIPSAYPTGTGSLSCDDVGETWISHDLSDSIGENPALIVGDLFCLTASNSARVSSRPGGVSYSNAGNWAGRADVGVTLAFDALRWEDENSWNTVCLFSNASGVIDYRGMGDPNPVNFSVDCKAVEVDHWTYDDSTVLFSESLEVGEEETWIEVDSGLGEASLVFLRIRCIPDEEDGFSWIYARRKGETGAYNLETSYTPAGASACQVNTAATEFDCGIISVPVDDNGKFEIYLESAGNGPFSVIEIVRLGYIGSYSNLPPALGSGSPTGAGNTPNSVVSISFTDDNGISASSIDVDLTSPSSIVSHAIINGVFQSGFSGTLPSDLETSGNIIISTHPLLSEGSWEVDVYIEDDEAESDSANWSFDIEFIQYRNRVLDSQSSSYIRWITSEPDTAGTSYPGPGVFGVDTSDYCIEKVIVFTSAIIQGVYDSVAGKIVYWSTSSADSGGASYPGPGTYGVDTSGYRVYSVTEGRTGYTNRVYDPTDGFVTWITATPDTSGTSYPGTGPWGSISDYCVLPSLVVS